MDLQNSLPLSKSELIECKVVNATQTEFPFPTVTNLSGKKVRAIECFLVGDVAVALPSKNPVAADAVQKYAHLVLSVGDKEIINKIPLSALTASKNNGRIKMFDRLKIDWDKSKIVLSSDAATTGVIATTSFLFNVYYED